MGLIVATELAIRDRDSFDWWWPLHLDEIDKLVDRLYLRVDNDTYDAVVALLEQHPIAAKATVDRQLNDEVNGITYWEDRERQALLAWAHEQGAEWVTCFDADERIEPGGGAALRSLLNHSSQRRTRLVRVILTYCSHHRPDYVLPRGGFMPWRAFRIDKRTRHYRYQSDRDGLHCGSVPAPGVGSVTVPDLRVIHYHATTCAEYMDERRFYDQTIEVDSHGGIDWLYRCDRFGDEADAIPLDQELTGADERLARLATGQGVSR